MDSRLSNKEDEDKMKVSDLGLCKEFDNHAAWNRILSIGWRIILKP